MKQYKYTKKSKVRYVMIVLITMLVGSIVAYNILVKKEEELKVQKVVAIHQGSKKVKYYKVNEKGDMINIDKVTLESLMKRYDLILEEVK